MQAHMCGSPNEGIKNQAEAHFCCEIASRMLNRLALNEHLLQKVSANQLSKALKW